MNRRFVKKEHIIYREEADGAFLFDPGNGNLKYMNRIGREMFMMLDGNRDVDQVVAALLERYPEIAPDRMRTDIEGFVNQLSENEFIGLMDPNHLRSPHE